jgi:hypothetical protein
METTGWVGVAAVLDDFHFPGNRQDIVNHARQRHPGEDILRLVRGLPTGVYRNLTDVRDALRADRADEERLAS